MNMNLEATSLNRRAFLARAGTGAAALSLGGLSPLFAQEKKTYPQGKAEHCIFVWLGGGAAHMDTWDPKRVGDPQKKIAGSAYPAIDTAIPGVQVCEHLKGCAKKSGNPLPENKMFTKASLNDKIGAILTDAQKPMLAQALNPAPAGARGGGRGGPGAGVSWQQLALEKGWGYGSLNTGSVQADNGAGLTRGIIGLINKGQARKADDWGVLRTWAWGFSKLMDFFETDNLVDVKQVGVEGHSRWGKATAATMVYDSRVASGYVSSSGEGGAKIWRHLMGETVENITGSGEYHWMAGNFIKYGGPLTVNDLPGDAHELVALIAPRPVFVGGGNSGDAWQDPHGMFMAAAGASPVWELLGKKGLSNDALGINHLTMQSPMTGVQVPVIDGDIGFRLHEQGHTDAPNWPTFIEFASRYLHAPGH